MGHNQILISRESILNETYYYINRYDKNDEYDSKIPLNIFITETLSRSYSTYFILQLANIYLSWIITIKEYNIKKINMNRRKLFLGSLIIATKMLLDKSYSNKVWGMMTGVSNKEINHIELEFLNIIDYNAFVNINEFNIFLRNNIF
jgi:hypothetical protein